MIATGQKSALNELKLLASHNKQSILLEGGQGVGKTYLAKQYALFVDVPDFQIVQPKVQEIRETVEECSVLRTPVVICIENLDLGMAAASYALLKFLEEPSANVYIVVTCRNIRHIPDTIISRSEVVTVSPPTDSDIFEYANGFDDAKFEYLKSKPIWKCAVTFQDAEDILKLSVPELEYFEKLQQVMSSKEPISSKAWKLQKFEDSKDTPIRLVIRYLMNLYNKTVIWDAGYSCLKDLDTNRISANAILSKFLLECKYAK